MLRKWKKQGLLYGGLAILFLLMVSGCSLFAKDTSKITPDEEHKVKESTVQYIQEKYGKEFVITKVTKGRILGDYNIHGTIKDGKNTPVFVGLEPPKKFSDTYVDHLFTAELRPSIKELATKIFDLRTMEDNFSFGYRDGVKRKYTHEIPSVFEVLKRGDKDLRLDVGLHVYNQGGQAQVAVTKFLQELQRMYFNKVAVTIYIYDDQLKSTSKKEDPGNYMLLRYIITNDDIQKLNVNDLEQFKTVIKE
ncbi:hypothetical protein SAMN04487866_10895 [Thermoactinomyces sp. DSM 45891]|uniref:hypothetical protein n=1 Tax=Thermoactinomyces sp. DSM 45891 TaxID=1761907 RepID=UPI00091EAD12|nr:hypothetical protein [Thermoactinomyces sp. DSM 45891]SFX46035.1 hypothetical protein SAMN04487866_10895 [Thermoactinomyces sp. DSM 45891]